VAFTVEEGEIFGVERGLLATRDQRDVPRPIGR
jgi:hypothetical protein